jgi:acyl dehydratase
MLQNEFTATINPQHLQAFCTYFGYNNTLPLTYFYLPAQRAHVGLIIDKSFPVPVVGLVHLENTISLKSTPNVAKPFRIETSVSAPDADGSIPFTFTATFYQDDVEVLSCTSLYLCKRKRKTAAPKTKAEKEGFSLAGLNTIKTYSIAASKGNSYARLSGDYNPIHTSFLLAKLFGFKSKIIHGWYTVSKALADMENAQGIRAKDIFVAFQNPLLLPGKAVLHTNVKKEEDTAIDFVVTDTNNSLLYVSGKVGF